MMRGFLVRPVLAGVAILGLGLAVLPAHGQEPAALQGETLPAHCIWLESLDLSQINQGWDTAKAARSMGDHTIKIHGAAFAHGIGTHAESQMNIDLKGVATQFASMVGIDDETEGKGKVRFLVVVDGKPAADSGTMLGNQPAKLLQADLRGAKRLSLLVVLPGDRDTTDNCHADWAGARLELAADATVKPATIDGSEDPSVPGAIVPPLVREDSPRPAIHDPRITGATPGRPFLFLVPATGEPPLRFSARNLPAGLTLDPATGIIRGSLRQPATAVVELTVSNALGQAEGKLTIVGGEHKLGLTPPMGWNSWNCWAGEVSDAKVRAAADAMVRNGLAAHGFQYVNIDDCWEGPRDAQGNIRSNAKFPDMKALADYIHSKGLKFGLYSSPGPKTCARYTGSWQHEQQDADTYAAWGVDYLKYDWCSYDTVSPNHSRENLIKPYRVMRTALDRCGRDIFFSLCQAGMGDVWTWGAEAGGNCWRTTDDIGDTWQSVSGIGFGQAGHERFAGPGHWNDPDMLVVGKVGTAWGSLHRTRLKPSEQITHITLWSLLAAPLLIGCDMSQMDDFTRTLLTNGEVLAVDQDPLGKQAWPVVRQDAAEVWARPLADAAWAVGLFNRNPFPANVKVRWADLKLNGPQPVRDLWRQKDLGPHADGYQTAVPPHGAVLLKVGQAKN
jgi:alpha-galactosidase